MQDRRFETRAFRRRGGHMNFIIVAAQSVDQGLMQCDRQAVDVIGRAIRHRIGLSCWG